MFDKWEQFKDLIGRLVNGAASQPKPPRSRLQLEALEERWCPAIVWTWNGPAGMTSNWSDPNGGNWLVTVPGLATVPAAAGMYPGQAGSVGDVVKFNNGDSGPANEDVQLGAPLGALEVTTSVTLTINNPVTVTGAAGDFLLDFGTISIGGNGNLWLTNLGGANSNFWWDGTITGTGPFVVAGSQLTITPDVNGLNLVFLGTNMYVRASSSDPSQNGSVTLVGMNTNLVLTGTDNAITVGNGGTLNLNQNVPAKAQNTVGGIAVGTMATTGQDWDGDYAVQVFAGGTLSRSDLNLQGTVDQVLIGGAVYNDGGTVTVNGTYDKLAITGSDENGYSYWQGSAASSLLQLATGTNINGVGTFEIDTGTLQFGSGGSSQWDDLDSAGLNFGNDAPTNLTFVAFAGTTPGTVTVHGAVTLAANTTTTLNYTGADATTGDPDATDLLDVQGGVLTLAGSLYLNSLNSTMLSEPGVFFDDNFATAAINGAFAPITDSTKSVDTGKPKKVNNQTWLYLVTMKQKVKVNMQSSLNPSQNGQAVTFLATVTTPDGGMPTGTVSFVDEDTGDVLDTVALDGSNQVEYTTSTLPVGDVTLDVTYSGDCQYAGNTSLVLTQVVDPATTTTDLTSSVNPSQYGQGVTFTAYVMPSYSGASPTGTVTFFDGTTALDTETLTSSGAVSFTTSSLVMGNHTVTAVYSGDSTWTGSTSDELTQVVNTATTSVNLTASLNPSYYGEAVTFTALVSPSYYGTTPTGTVTFYNGSTLLATVTLVNGQASFTISTLPVGTNPIAAFYSGDSIWTGSTSNELDSVVVSQG